MISFCHRGEPLALKRHRTTTRNGAPRQYDPSKRDKEDFLAAVQRHAPPVPFEEPLILTVVFQFTRPAYHFRANGAIKERYLQERHTTRPDVDNLGKFVSDALNGVFWRDDKQITCVRWRKVYGDYGQTLVTVEFDLPTMEVL